MLISKCLFPSITGNYLSKDSSTHSMTFFFLFWMTLNFCSLPGQFILERIKETRLEMIGAGDQVFIWEGWRQITGKG